MQAGGRRFEPGTLHRAEALHRYGFLCILFVYMTTTTIRVPAETRDRLNALAKRRGASAGDVVGELVRDADDRALLEDAEEGWRRLAADAAALAAYRTDADELAAFDAEAPPY